MSKSGLATAPKIPSTLSQKSAWSRGPPQQQQQQQSQQQSSQPQQSSSNSSVVPSRSQSPANANVPQTHSRRPSALGGPVAAVALKDGVSVSKGIAGAARPASVYSFGTVSDDPSTSPPPISSASPAASHAAPTPAPADSAPPVVKTFGSIDATINGAPAASTSSTTNTTASTAPKPRPQSTFATTNPLPTPAPSTPQTPTSATTAKKKIDIHKLFQGGASTSTSTPTPSTSQPSSSSAAAAVSSPPVRIANLPAALTASPTVRPGQPPPPSQPSSSSTPQAGYPVPASASHHLRLQQTASAGAGPRSPQYSRPLPNGAPGRGGANAGQPGANNQPGGAMGSPRLGHQSPAGVGGSQQPGVGPPSGQAPAGGGVPQPQQAQQPGTVVPGVAPLHMVGGMPMGVAQQQWGGYPYYYYPPGYDPQYWQNAHQAQQNAHHAQQIAQQQAAAAAAAGHPHSHPLPHAPHPLALHHAGPPGQGPAPQPPPSAGQATPTLPPGGPGHTSAHASPIIHHTPSPGTPVAVPISLTGAGGLPHSPRVAPSPLNTSVPMPPTPTSGSMSSAGPPGKLHANANSFVPRKGVTIRNPSSGEEVNFATMPKAGPPVNIGGINRRSVVRMESEESKQKRLEEARREEERIRKKKEDEAKAREAELKKQREEEKARKAEEERVKREKEEEERKKKEEEERLRREEARRAEERKKREEEEEKRRREEAEEKRRKQEAEERARKEAEEAAAAAAAAAKAKEEEAAAKAKKEEEERQRLLEEEAEKERLRKEAEEAEKERIRKEAAAATTPTTPSMTPAPLPARPALNLETKRARPIPGRLDLSATSAKGDLPKPLPSALASARIIENLDKVNYPEGVSAPKGELNVGAENGKFRYDRDFLLQFMSVCKEKPDMLPPLDAIGLEPSDQSSGSTFGMRGADRRRVSTLQSPAGAPGPRGIGFGVSSGGSGTGFGGKAGGPGVGGYTGMGNFSQPSRLSSEERFAQSNLRSVSGPGGPASASGVGGPIPFPGRVPMTRSNSQGGPGGAQGQSAPGATPGHRTRSQRGNKRNESKPGAVPQSLLATSTFGPNGTVLEPIVPLEVSANRWIPGTQRRGAQGEVDSTEVVERKVKSLLNKLTMEKFDSISDQIVQWANKSEKEKDGRTLIQVIKLVFEKATDEATWSEMYARLCRKMMEQISQNVQDDGIKNAEGLPIAGGQLFRKYLLNRCQEDFERGWSAKESAALAAASKAADDKAAKDEAEKNGTQGEVLYSEEYYVAQKAKRQGLGLVKFIGELFKLQMLTERIMHECIKKLLSNVENPEEEEIESLCKLLSTVGQALDTTKARNHMDIYFTRMKELCQNNNITPRMQFMLQDVIELRERKWVARNAMAAPTTIAQVHEAAAKEKAAAEKESYQRSLRDPMARGGSRRGEHSRTDTAASQDGWNSVPRPPAKAGDLTRFGKIDKPTQMSFGPGSVFAGKKDSKSGRDSPASLSRVSSSSNMFSMLSGNSTEPAPEPAAPSSRASSSRPPSRKTSVDFTQSGIPDAPAVRKKLTLLPRSVPAEDQREVTEETGTGDNTSESEDDSAPSRPTLTPEQADKKVEEDVKELFVLRNLEEAEAYFDSLAREHRHRLVSRIVTVAIDAKEADVKLAVDLFLLASEKGLAQPTEFEEGFTTSLEFLDDISVDAPAAYSVAARLLRASSIDDTYVERIADKIVVEGDPRETPKARLLREFASAQ